MRNFGPCDEFSQDDICLKVTSLKVSESHIRSLINVSLDICIGQSLELFTNKVTFSP